jgi:hypothetical protein
MLPEDGVLKAETCQSDICNIHEHCVHLVGLINIQYFKLTCEKG